MMSLRYCVEEVGKSVEGIDGFLKLAAAGRKTELWRNNRKLTKTHTWILIRQEVKGDFSLKKVTYRFQLMFGGCKRCLNHAGL